MITLSKKLALAVSLLALSSWQFVAFGSEPNHAADQRNKPQVVVIPMELEAPKRDMVTMHQTPKEIWKKILTIASTDNHPADLQKVCVLWRNILRENADPVPVLNYYNLNSFMIDCMDLYWDGMFRKGILRYTPKDGGDIIDLKFSDLADPLCGTFDLSGCGNKSQSIRITTSVEDFFKVGGENQGRLVVLICPYQSVKQAVNSTPDHPFTVVLASWDKSKAPVGMFWRWCDWKYDKGFDHHTAESLSKLSSKSLYENWRKSPSRHPAPISWCGECHEFSCLFLTNQN